MGVWGEVWGEVMGRNKIMSNIARNGQRQLRGRAEVPAPEATGFCPLWTQGDEERLGMASWM